MALTVFAEGIAAYASVDEADALAEYRVSGAAFLALSETQKEQALVTATRDLDSIGEDFIGEKTDASQVTEWPRTGTDYASDVIPDKLVEATIEAAIALVPLFAAGATADPLNTAVSNIKRREVGPVKIEYFDRTPTHAATAIERLPAVVQRLIASLIWIAPAAGWGGSATVSRGS